MRRFLLILIALLLPWQVFATTTLYVDTDAVSPSPPTYSTLAAAEAAIPYNPSDDYVIECSGSSVDSTVIFDGNTYATAGLTVVGDGEYTIEMVSGDEYGLNIYDDGITIDRINFSAASGATGILVQVSNPSTLNRLMIDGHGEACAGIYFTTAADVYNCLVTACNKDFYGGARVGGGTVNFYNCTFDNFSGPYAAAVRVLSTTTFINCIFTRATGSYGTLYNTDATMSYCITDDGEAYGTGSLPNAIASDLYTSPGTDYTLKTGSNAIGAGTDLSAYFTTDITGAPRSSPWDIGAFAYATAATGWAGKIYGITPAKIMGVPVSNISKVGGL